MNRTEYLNRWKVIDGKFNDWFAHQDWDKQEKFLSKQINTELGISKTDIKKIFKTFSLIFPYGNFKVMFSWEEQLQVLKAIAANYLK